MTICVLFSILFWIFHFWLFLRFILSSFFFFFNDTATTEIYTLSLHDALPISKPMCGPQRQAGRRAGLRGPRLPRPTTRSEEHTSELQSQSNLVCRLLLEKKKQINMTYLH